MGLGKRKQKYIQEENRFEEIIEAPAKPIKPLPNIKKVEGEVRVPKSVKPLSKKHFQPILEDVRSLKDILADMQKNQDEMFEILNQWKTQNKPAEIKPEEIKPEEEIKP